LGEHKAKLPEADANEIQKDINDLKSLIADNLTTNDVPRLKEQVE
jgi:hypothetical protein